MEKRVFTAEIECDGVVTDPLELEVTIDGERITGFYTDGGSFYTFQPIDASEVVFPALRDADVEVNVEPQQQGGLMGALPPPASGLPRGISGGMRGAVPRYRSVSFNSIRRFWARAAAVSAVLIG